MSAFTIPNRPFSTDLITGLMLPDGLFVTLLGRQNITIHLANSGAVSVGISSVYIETVSHPGIVFTPRTHIIWGLNGNASTVLAWTADFKTCPAGTHHISIIVENSGGRTRIIKEIFVLGLTFDPSRGFIAETPEGVMTARFGDLIKPRRRCRRSADQEPLREQEEGRYDLTDEDRCHNGEKDKSQSISSIFEFADYFHRHYSNFNFCPPGYLPKVVEYSWRPTPPYSGQYGDLPFEDSWWKVLLAIIAFLLIVAASIAEAVDGSGEVVAEVEFPPSSSGPAEHCCGVKASGGGTSYVAAGLVAAAAAVATAAGLSDDRDAFRIGQDKAPPGVGEITTLETFLVEFSYPEPIALGRPFSVNAEWRYTRQTNVTTYTYTQKDAKRNVHVASSYKITAPAFAVRDNPDLHWIVKGRFTDKNSKLFSGSELFVQCILVGPNGEWHRFYLQDDGNWPDEVHADGTYCGRFDFRAAKAIKGLWSYYVIAQDVNNTKTDMTPEEAAQIVGGMVLTHQLRISFTKDECALAPDGHVVVV